MTSIITEKYGDTLSTLESLGEFGNGTVFGAIKADGSSIDSPFYIVVENDVPREVYMPVYSDEFYPQSEFAQIEEKYKFFEDILDLEEDEDVEEEPLEDEVDNDLGDKTDNAGKGNPYREAKTGKFTTGGLSGEEQISKPSAKPQAQQDALTKLENDIRSRPKERFYAVDTEGNTIAELDGNENQVKIDFMTASKIATSKNAVLTHNHPSQGHKGGEQKTYPFSEADILAASTMNPRAIRAVGTTHEYEMGRKGDKWPLPSEIKRTKRASLKKADKVLWEKVGAGDMTREQASFERHHIALQEVAVKFDLEYARKAL